MSFYVANMQPSCKNITVSYHIHEEFLTFANHSSRLESPSPASMNSSASTPLGMIHGMIGFAKTQDSIQ